MADDSPDDIAGDAAELAALTAEGTDGDADSGGDSDIDLSSVAAFAASDEDQDFAESSMGLEDVLSTESGEGGVPLPELEESEQMPSPANTDSSAVDFAALDVPPVDDPFNDELDQQMPPI
jgi:hypothetical protein